MCIRDRPVTAVLAPLCLAARPLDPGPLPAARHSGASTAVTGSASAKLKNVSAPSAVDVTLRVTTHSELHAGSTPGPRGASKNPKFEAAR